jgi:hypothetical protein
MPRESVFKSNQQGICPSCDRDDLKYEREQFDGEYLYFKWTCCSCGKQGSEWYLMEFTGHKIINENNREQEVGNVR